MDIRSVSSLDNQSLCIWDILSRYNKSSLVIDVPYTWPPHKIDGVLACFKPIRADDDVLAEPPSVNRYIKEQRFDKITAFHPDYPILDLARFKEIAALEVDFTKALHHHYDWDMAFVVFMITDTVIHLYPHSTDSIKKVYEIYGKFPELHEEEDSFTLKNYNCLVFSVAKEDPLVCAVDEKIITELAGVPAQKEKCIREGDECCLYRLKKAKPKPNT